MMLRGRRRNYLVIGIIIAPVAVGVTIFLGYWFKWNWTGFNEHIGPNVQQYQPTKTLWDWLNLLGILAIPAVVALGAAWYTAQQGKVSEKANTDNQREAALQAYIDKMSELLLKNDLRNSSPEGEVRIIARVRTISILFQLDARRIGYVFAFLREAELMSNATDSSIVSLSQANLDKINFSQANLSYANLSNAYLNDADLSEANLFRVNLNQAKLSKANLSQADLRGAQLNGAELSNAELSKANLRRTRLGKADLSGADLRGANLSNSYLSNANLSGANLRGANLSEANLSGVDFGETNLAAIEQQVKSLQGATMPDGSKHP